MPRVKIDKRIHPRKLSDITKSSPLYPFVIVILIFIAFEAETFSYSFIMYTICEYAIALIIPGIMKSKDHRQTHNSCHRFNRIAFPQPLKPSKKSPNVIGSGDLDIFRYTLIEAYENIAPTKKLIIENTNESPLCDSLPKTS